MTSFRKSFVWLTLSSLLASYTPAGASVRSGGYTAEALQTFAGLYNEHRKLDAKFYGTFFPSTAKNADAKKIEATVRELATESGVTELAEVAAVGQVLTFKIHTETGAEKSAVVDFSAMSSGSLKVNGQTIDWNAKTPIEERVGALRAFLEKEYGPAHSSIFSLIPDAEASLLLVIAVVLIGVLVAIATVPNLKAHADDAVTAQLQQLNSELDVELRSCELDHHSIESDLANTDRTGLQSVALKDIREAVSKVQDAQVRPELQKLCRAQESNAAAKAVCDKYNSVVTCRKGNVQDASSRVQMKGGKVSGAEDKNGAASSPDQVEVSFPKGAGKGL